MCTKVVNNKFINIKKLISISLIMVSAILFIGCSHKEITETNKNQLTISVAASLLEPMNKIKQAYEKENNVVIDINAGGSGTLKRQISEGANIDMYFSANEKYITELKNEKLIKEEDSYPLLVNSLVLVKNNNFKEKIQSFEDLKDLDVKIALGETTTVPAGEYAKEALENMGIWDNVKSKIIYGKNVNVVKTYVENGEVDLGIIYKSDTTDFKNGVVALEIPKDKHEEIVYSLAIIKNSENYSESNKFIEYIKSNECKEIFKEYGFNIK